MRFLADYSFKAGEHYEEIFAKNQPSKLPSVLFGTNKRTTTCTAASLIFIGTFLEKVPKNRPKNELAFTAPTKDPSARAPFRSNRHFWPSKDLRL